MRRLLRLVAWNAGLALAALVLTALAGEAWLRLTKPFMDRANPLRFVPAVGRVHEPDAEVRWTNGYDYWTVSRANRRGFLDRDPSPERAAASCHVSLIGDSFVDAREVPIADKVQVRLEALAVRRLPHLDVTTSAFGISGTSQIAQLSFYDAYARRLSPKLVVLVFVPNDFQDNSPVLAAARGVPVISQRAWIERRGEDVRDAHWTHDAHWTPTDHRWAAEALLDWLTHNQDVCHQAAATS